MPVVDILDSTWVHASPASLGVLIGDEANWRRWWPGLRLTATELRGPQGARWDVARIGAGPARGLAGTAEIWLQPSDDGVVVHFFLRLDPPAGGRVDDRATRRMERHYRAQTKRAFWAVADELDPGRRERSTQTRPRAAAGTRARA